MNLLSLHNERYVNRYGARLIDSEVVAIVNYLILQVDRDEREPLRVAINRQRERFGLIPIYSDYMESGEA